MFIDNGIGMKKEILEGLLDERSIKSNNGSGGSYGVGHLSSYFLSSLRYVLYATKYKENGKIEKLFTRKSDFYHVKLPVLLENR